MRNFVVFEASGRIMQTGQVPDEMLELQRTGGRLVIEGTGHWDTHYVKGGVLLPRPPLPAKMNGANLTGLPINCTIYINDKPYPCTDTEAELAFAYPGKYDIRVEAFPYLNANFTVDIP